MSTQNPDITPLGPGDLMESPVQTMWKWHLVNDLTFQPADTLENCFVHKLIAAEILNKSHVADSTNKKGIFLGVRRHENSVDLLRYGDLLKTKKKKPREGIHEHEETPT